ncbi:sulfatase family protein [Pelagicoccus mobilis]|uniref:Sulfatase-like hydrolase/transferase n=1 Tax=Pelagicoccus mobilis TaxID=415221 RepID=A0A934S4X0_9BACT|nr:sulfatase-like hydrolase/transferase [Pelagicoccus mobilis]MBK1879837.1 sulfatase-like hydrolase/transferase [Pelagicoccus mobilis]
MHSWKLILAVIVGGFGSLCAKSERPNVIIILTDDQSPFAHINDAYRDGAKPQEQESWAAYGAPVYSPNVDRLAERGMLFTDANVTTTVCTPSRYTTLTGRYAARTEGARFNGMFPEGSMTRVENNVELGADELNLARILQGNGYRTGFVGKSHFINHDLMLHRRLGEDAGLKLYDQGSDPSNASVDSSLKHNHDVWRKWIQAYGFDYVESHYQGNLRELYNDKLNQHNMEYTAKAAIEFVQEAAGDPFFLYFAPTMPHDPNAWEKDGKGKYHCALDADPRVTPEGYMAPEYDFMPTRSQIMRDVVDRGFHPDTAYITWMDAAFGALFDALEEKGALDNTLIVFASDHGAYRYGKSTLYEGGMRVPLIVSWPRVIEGGSRFDGLVSNIDYVPTILEACQIQVPDGYHIDGVSLMPALLDPESTVIHESILGDIGYSRGVKTKKWKYVAVRYPESVHEKMLSGGFFPNWSAPGREQPYLVRNSHLGWHAAEGNPNYFQLDQLYDLENDPEELKNLFLQKPIVAARMKALLSQHLKQLPDHPFGEFTE